MTVAKWQHTLHSGIVCKKAIDVSACSHRKSRLSGSLQFYEGMLKVLRPLITLTRHLAIQ